MINFFSEKISFILENESRTRTWIYKVINSFCKEVQEINFIFCTDNYLLALNRKHLQHNYYTDIITFPYYNSPSSPLFADIYISIERVKDNASSLGVDFKDELDRVIIHGVLHLLGFNDFSENDKVNMRKEENKALLLRE